MNRITVTPTMRRELPRLDEQAEVCDEAGHRLGYFVPLPESDPKLLRQIEEDVTDEELDRVRREPGGTSLGKVLDGLRSR